MDRLYTVDLGNSHPHVGEFSGERLLQVTPLSEFSFSKHPQHIPTIVSQVTSFLPLALKSRPLICAKDFFRDQSFLGMPVHYTQSLGIDRLVQAYYLYSQSKMEGKTLLIDSGTFETLDLIGEEGFLGGYILPGQELYLRPFYQNSVLNAHLQGDKEAPSKKSTTVIPQKTNEACFWGRYGPLTCFIRDLVEREKILKIILTGGGASEFLKLLRENNIEAEERRHLIHDALRLIYSKSF